MIKVVKGDVLAVDRRISVHVDYTDHYFSVSKRVQGMNRLLTLQNYLKDQVKSKRFDLNSWVNLEAIAGKPTTKKKVVELIKEGSCGTTACACGHAATIPEFNAKGLKLEVSFEWGFMQTSKRVSDISVVYSKNDYRYCGIAAAEQFFSLTLDEAEYLFDPSHYLHDRNSKYYVIRRINSQIKKMAKQITESKNI
jgi:hypothetical protein